MHPDRALTNLLIANAVDLRVLEAAVVLLAILVAICWHRSRNVENNAARLEAEIKSLRNWSHSLNGWLTMVAGEAELKGVKVPPLPTKEVE